MVWEKLKDSLIFTNLEAKTTADVFSIMGGELTRQGYAKDSYVEALNTREAEYPTGLDIDGVGVALPHTDVSHTNNTAIAVATLRNPVVFNEMGGEEEDKVNVNVVFMLCVNDPGGHMDVLQRVVTIIQDKSVMTKIQNAGSKDEIISIIRDKESVLDEEAS
ncbi:MAG: PTS sugar transporter subunit IIA [Eubacteriales bacterium]|jgi:PTS system galactitol-specific IIA component